MAKTLIELKSGEVGRVVSVVGGKGATVRLAAHGIVPGVVVEKIGNLTGGPVVLKNRSNTGCNRTRACKEGDG